MAERSFTVPPELAAQTLAGKKTHTLGAIFPEIASGFYADVLAGIDEVAAESGFDVLAAFAGKKRSRPELVKRFGSGSELIDFRLPCGSGLEVLIADAASEGATND